MKTIPILAAATLSLLITMNLYYRLEQQPTVTLPASETVVMPASHPVTQAKPSSNNWMAAVHQDIASREYHIHYNADEGHHQSPNRANNTRITYLPQKLRVTPRTLQEFATPDAHAPHAPPEVVAAHEDYTLDIAVKGYGTINSNVYPFTGDTLISNQHTATVTTAAMQVEYINNVQGTRQNFILHQPVAGNELAVHLTLQTTLTAKTDEQSIVFTGKQADTKLYYRDLKVWDATGKPLAARMVLNETPSSNRNEHLYNLQLAVNTTGATYPITVDPIVANGTPANANRALESNQADAYFGFAVSSAGDVNADGYSDVIIAAHYYDNGQSEEGVAFVYHGSATGIGASAAIMLESNVASALFGCDVRNAGDVNGDGFGDVIVGMRGFSNGQSAEGGFRIYHGSASGLNTTAAAQVESNLDNANMGISVSGAGDVNGDGYSDVIVGADDYNNASVSGGAAFVYQGSASGISTTPAALLQLNTAGVFFGQSVSNAGDVNGDGYSDVVVGAPEYDNGQPSEGAAIVFHGSASGLSTTPAVILESNLTSAAGTKVACAGDINGDGYSDILSGAWYYENGEAEEGAVYVYYGSVTGVGATPVRIIESNQMGAWMGYAAAMAGDVNGDGYSDVLVGAYNYDNGQTDEGVTYVYHGSASGLSAAPVSTIESNQASAILGRSAACAGDVNGDGYSDIIVGAHNFENGQNDEGAAFVYHGSASGIGLTGSLIIEGNQNHAWLGTSVANAGDVNGDGYSDVIIGAYSFSNGQSDEGLVYIYHGGQSGVNTTPSIVLESNQANAQLGISVASAGDLNGDGYSDVVIGAWGYSNNQSYEGAAFVYYGSSSGIIAATSTLLESNQANALFGVSVSSAGDYNGDGYSDLIIGSRQYSNGQTYEGAAFLYLGTSTGISSVSAIMWEGNQPYAYMGYSVAGGGDFNGDGYSDVVIGAFNYSNGQTNEGKAFSFHGSSSSFNASPAMTWESNQANAQLGVSVAIAGDVNGDGYSDIIVGAQAYSNGQTNEGAAFIYHGGAGGLSPTSSVVIEGDQLNAGIGGSVFSAGDVNGDGYSDVIVENQGYTNGQLQEGAMYVYYGTSAGVSLSSKTILESNFVNAQLGISVASAGDVNADGYSDIIGGADRFSNNETEEGAAFIYYGNGGTTGRRNQVRLYNTDLTTPIQRSNGAAASFGAGLYASSPQGRQKVKMVWEVKQQGQAFSSAGGTITNSVGSTSVQTNFSNTGAGATHLSNLVSKPGLQSKVRCRVMYDMVTSVTGQKYGPWRYPQGYLNGMHSMGSTPVPVEWLSFTAAWLTPGESAQLNWSTASEKNNSHFTVLRSIDGQNWEEVTQVNGAGTTNNISQYSFIDTELKHLNTQTQKHPNTQTPKHVYYRLMQTDDNGQFSFSDIRELTFSTDVARISVSPNPGSTPVLTLQQPATTDLPYTLVDIQGRVVGSGIVPKGSMQCDVQLQHLPAGVYVLSITSAGKQESIKLIRQ